MKAPAASMERGSCAFYRAGRTNSDARIHTTQVCVLAHTRTKLSAHVACTHACRQGSLPRSLAPRDAVHTRSAPFTSLILLERQQAGGTTSTRAGTPFVLSGSALTQQSDNAGILGLAVVLGELARLRGIQAATLGKPALLASRAWTQLSLTTG